MDMPFRSRSKGRHGSRSRRRRALKPMKQTRVSASTPPQTASGVAPERMRSSPSAGQAVGAGAPPRGTERGHHLGGYLGADPGAEACGVYRGQGTDRAGSMREPGPEGLGAGPVGADHAQPADHHAGHAVLERIQRERLSRERNSSARSWPSSMTMPKRSSMATESSMKSSESSPREPSMPLGRVVSAVISAARRGPNFNRSTMMALSSSRISFCVIRSASDQAARRRARYGA